MNQNMSSAEIRSRFLKFFEKRGHRIIDSASLVTSDEKGITNSTLFNIAGMQPLMPYLLGAPHPSGSRRLVNVQKCLRTVDIDGIGDKTHATFFEMLGNWSLGDYWKEDAIKWSYEFLTSKEEGLGLNPEQLYVTVFEGDESVPRDEESADIWKKIFRENRIPGNRIFYLPAKNNWWEIGENGPCGPDTEMYYDILNKFKNNGLHHDEFIKADEARDVVEIWNDVFMQYEKKNGKIIGKLAKPSVDTGAGLERLAMVMQRVDNIYDTDLLKPVMDKIKNSSKKYDLKSARIIADHLKASTFLIGDGVEPSNTDRGYILRRLLRRAIRHSKVIGLDIDLIQLVQSNDEKIKEEIKKEIARFEKTLEIGLREFNRGTDAFTLFSSYGFPIELTLELAKEKGIEVDIKKYEEEMKKHQSLSRSGAEQKFKGGLADPKNEMVLRYHTATHILHQALHDILGDKVMQKGSNITEERLRFDFSLDRKMTDEEKKKVEDIVNKKIQESLPMNMIVMDKSEAEKTGARHSFGDKYGDEVSIYFIGNSLENAYSKEFCGGPHVGNTIELAGPNKELKFKIQKEEAVAQGIRRIKAVLV